jgi:2-polyprenyl-3-methyl-5-hydroxy-6-metoxy-1,4-benzoquinol methylase
VIMDDGSNTRSHNGADAQNHWDDLAAKRRVENADEVASLGLYGSSLLYDGYRARAEEKIVYSFLPEIKPTWRVLDVGCGPGRWTVPFARKCAHVTAVDFSNEMISIARRQCEKAGIVSKLDFHQQRIEEISSDSVGGPFDLVLLMGVLQYVPETLIESTIARLAACLKPGGLLIHRETRSPQLKERIYRDESGREIMRSFYKPFSLYCRHFESNQLRLLSRRSIIPPSLAYSLYSRIMKSKEGIPEGAFLKSLLALHEKIIDPLWRLFPGFLWFVNSRRETDQAIALYQR